LPTIYGFEKEVVFAERPFDPTLKDGDINYYDIKAMIESSDTEAMVALDGEILISLYQSQESKTISEIR